MRTIALLGSTGSIGVSTLALVREFPDRFRVHGMVAGRNLKLLAQQIKEFRLDAYPSSKKTMSRYCADCSAAPRLKFFAVKRERRQSQPRPRSMWCLRRSSAAPV